MRCLGLLLCLLATLLMVWIARVPWLDEPTAGVESTSRLIVTHQEEWDRFHEQGSESCFLLVVDDETLEPVTSFGARVLRGQGESARVERRDGRSVSLNFQPCSVRLPMVGRHREGAILLEARPGFDGVGIFAPGFLPARTAVASASSESSPQVIRLRRGGTLAGKVLFGGHPVEGVEVHVVSAALSAEGAGESPLEWHRSSLADLSFFDDTGEPHGVWTSDPEDGGSFRVGNVFGNVGCMGDEVFQCTCKRIGQTDCEGWFRIPGLAGGEYYLGFRTDEGATAFLDRKTVGPGCQVEVGDVQLLPPATLRGRVELPAGCPTRGVEVTLRDLDSVRRVRVSETGGFSVGRLIPGTFWVDVHQTQGKLLHGRPVEVSLLPGETREVEIDRRLFGVCQLDLEVELGVDVNEPPPLVYLVSKASPAERLVVGKGLRQNRSLRALGEAHVEVELPSGMILRHPTEVISPTPGADLSVRVRITAGRLQIELPAAVLSPRRGRALLRVRSLNPRAAWPEQELDTYFGSGENKEADGLEAEDEHRRFRTDPLLAGDYELHFELLDQDSPTVTPKGGRPFKRPTYHWQAIHTVREGETSTILMD